MSRSLLEAAKVLWSLSPGSSIVPWDQLSTAGTEALLEQAARVIGASYSEMEPAQDKIASCKQLAILVVEEPAPYGFDHVTSALLVALADYVRAKS